MRVNDAKLMTFASKGNYHIFLRKNYESRKEKVSGIGRSEGTDSTKFFEYLRVYNAPLMTFTSQGNYHIYSFPSIQKWFKFNGEYENRIELIPRNK